MALFERSLPAGIVMGVAVGYAAREVVPSLAPVIRPLTKTVVKGAILGLEKIKEAFAGVGESLEDLASEVRSELHDGGARRGEAAVATAGAEARGRRTRKEAEGEERRVSS